MGYVWTEHSKAYAEHTGVLDVFMDGVVEVANYRTELDDELLVTHQMEVAERAKEFVYGLFIEACDVVRKTTFRKNEARKLTTSELALATRLTIAMSFVSDKKSLI